MATPTLWDTLKKKTPTTSSPSPSLFHLLDERANIENLKPDHIESAKMERLDESSVLQKADKTTTKVNVLNTTMYVVTNPQTKQYFRLDEKEKFLWEHMDGHHTIRDLALEYYNHYGAFAYEKIVELVYDLKKKTFLTEEYVDIYSELSVWSKSKQFVHRISTAIKRFLYWDFPFRNVDAFFGRLYTSLFRIFFTKIGAITLLGIAIIGLGAFLFESRSETYSLLQANNSIVGGVALLFLLNFVSLFFHEVAHGVATKHFGRSVHKSGFLLYYGMPSFYVDTTDMWMEEKKNRITVSLVGPFTELLIAGVISIGLLFFPDMPLSALLYKFAFVSYFSVFMNLNPLVEWDGYFVLMDLLGIPCLRRRSLFFIKTSLRKKLQKREPFSREEILYATFGIFAAIWSVIAALLGIQFWQTQLSRIFIRN